VEMLLWAESPQEVQVQDGRGPDRESLEEGLE